MGIDKNKSINEHIDRLKYLSGFKINEAKYTLIDGLDEDDNIPDDVWKSPKPVSGADSNIMEDEEEEPNPNPEPEMGGEEVPAEEPAPEMGSEEAPIEEPMTEPMTEPEMGMEEPMPEPEESVDDLQNNILKTSVSAMQKMNDQLQNLELSLNSLNQKIEGLNSEVQQVKEPTNIQKLVARKEDSHPFYMNLNDMWDGNSFQARRQMEDSHGMKKLEDGTYVADFDTLPKYNEQEIKDSF